MFQTLKRGRRWLPFLLLACAVVIAVQVFNRVSLPKGVQVVTFEADMPRFGGWSAIDVDATGRQGWILNDGSFLAGVAIARKDDDTIESLSLQPFGYLIAPIESADVSPTDTTYRDAEGLALAPDGGAFVQFEQPPLLFHVTATDAVAPLSALQTGFPIGSNVGPEALAQDASGTLYTLPERPFPMRGPYTLWAQPPQGTWAPMLKIARKGRWRMTGADIGPDGALYLLERGITLGGFMSRVRRFSLDHPQLDAPLKGNVLYLSPPGRHGNLEGLSVWRDRADALRLLMVADDNHLPFQRGEIVEVTLR